MKDLVTRYWARVGSRLHPSPITGVEQGREIRPSQILLIGLWCGILTGLAEAFTSTIEGYFLQHFTVFNPDVFWMSPVVEASIFFALAASLALCARLFPHRVSRFLVFWVFGSLAFWSLLLMVPPLHPIAGLVLAAGIGLQLARLILKYQPRFVVLQNALRLRRSPQAKLASQSTGSAAFTEKNGELFTRRQFLVAAGAGLTGLTLGVRGWRQAAEARRLASLPSIDSGLPNVLLVVLDTVRAQNLGLYGYARATSPHLERWAEQGVVFDWALSAAPWTLPSHSSMFTGKFPHQLSANWTTPLDDKYPTLAEILSTHGYQTTAFVANLTYTSAEHGLARGFSHYEDYPISLGQFILDSSIGQYVSNRSAVRRLTGYDDILNRKSAQDIGNAFLEWLDARDRKRPFFAFLNFYDAHEPYLPPAPFAGMFGPRSENRTFHYMGGEVERPAKWNLSPAEVQSELNEYDSTIAFIDSELGTLHDALAAQNLLDNTLVIVTADHGEQFGEHGLFSHGNSLYIQTLHVPLLLSFPGRLPASLRIKQPVSLHNLPATILDLVQLNEAAAFGKSLAPYWNGSNNAKFAETPLLAEVTRGFGAKWYPNASGDMQALLFGMQHFIRNPDGSLHVYDLARDPLEENELAPNEWAVTAQEFSAQLEALMRSE